jgi:outer membrane usher protein
MHDRDNGAQSEWQLTRTSRVSNSASLDISANLLRTPAGRQFGVTSTLNLVTQRGVTAYVTSGETDGHEQLAANVVKSSPSTLPSFGYNAGFSSTQGSQLSGYASGQYRWPYGNYFGSVDVGGGGPASLSMQLAGGLVAIGGKFFATQPLTDGYALVETDGLAGVRVSANGMPDGRTNSQGYAIVPQLGAYFTNTVALTPGDVPLNYTIDRTSQDVVPEYRSGEIVEFRMKRVLPVTGVLSVLIKGQAVVPAYGIIEVRDGNTKATSDIGENGEFYFENLAPGTHDAHIQFKGGECSFQIDVPATQAKFLKLGTLTCKDGVSS